MTTQSRNATNTTTTANMDLYSLQQMVQQLNTIFQTIAQQQQHQQQYLLQQSQQQQQFTQQQPQQQHIYTRPPLPQHQTHGSYQQDYNDKGKGKAVEGWGNTKSGKGKGKFSKAGDPSLPIIWQCERCTTVHNYQNAWRCRNF